VDFFDDHSRVIGVKNFSACAFHSAVEKGECYLPTEQSRNPIFQVMVFTEKIETGEIFCSKKAHSLPSAIPVSHSK
jgi:hypothetical protein